MYAFWNENNYVHFASVYLGSEFMCPGVSPAELSTHTHYRLDTLPAHIVRYSIIELDRRTSKVGKHGRCDSVQQFDIQLPTYESFFVT